LDRLARPELHGVREEIGDYLLHPERVPLAAHGRVRVHGHRAPSFRRILAEPRHDVVHDRRQVHLLELEAEPSGLDARDIHELTVFSTIRDTHAVRSFSGPSGGTLGGSPAT
jgi:hypothetical protein